jgi:hypothetical protein
MPHPPGALRPLKSKRSQANDCGQACGDEYHDFRPDMRNSLVWLGNEQAERFGRGLNHLFNDRIERFGLVKDCEGRIRKHTANEMLSDARRRCEHDIAAAYAIESLSYHIEASYLPGKDAAFVYDVTSYYISQNGDAARATTVEPGDDKPRSGGP